MQSSVPSLYYGGYVDLSGHQFTLTDGPFPTETVTFAGNGLVQADQHGVLICTGRANGKVYVSITVQPRAPDQINISSWDEVVELSWTASGDSITLHGPAGPMTTDLTWTPSPPRDYRLRVHATGRDDPADWEAYELVLWPAPPSPPAIHKRTDKLGHRLRGEPEPSIVERPEAACDWIRHDWQQDSGACITVVTGRTKAEVLATLGARADRARQLGQPRLL
ncbi:hypothetical protein [Pseudonocardia spinosispora]|uniref:hypothetical protein n=1 Tax=Pseudonocardia spinosispora TaxID=103441 RepID=UPI0012EC222C|nr:hypothetical protein [Pseudonocardia spinosispora]